MTNYLNTSYNWKTHEIAFNYDDLPIWSSVPGNLLLENIEYQTNKTILDIGCGTGFPLIQIAQRFGNTCDIIGIDIWKNALDKAQQKLKIRGIKNVSLLYDDVSNSLLKDNSVDIITSNLGINNFKQPSKVIKECHRILNKDGIIYLTSNLKGTFSEFYNIFKTTAIALNNTNLLKNLNSHINSRQSSNSIDTIFKSNGFKVIDTKEINYYMRYTNGSAFFNDYFIIMSFLPAWKDLITDSNDLILVFEKLEENLNKLSKIDKGLNLSIPIVLKKIKKL